jgi:glutathionyl-hydroquinone reductase
MFYSAFDSFLDPQHREVNQPAGGLYPENLRSEIDAMNEWVYDTVNNGVYKVGFAGTQEAYDEHLYALFASLDRLEKHLEDPAHQPYLFGEHITEADVRLYTTMARFDAAYYQIFNCNLRMIRHGYPRIYRWLRTLYWDESDKTNGGAFKNTTHFGKSASNIHYCVVSLRLLMRYVDTYKHGYIKAKYRQLYGPGSNNVLIIPRGPLPPIHPLTDEEEQELSGATVTSPVEGSNGTNLASLSINDDAKSNGGKRTAHKDENAKWYKAAKKAEKQAGAANLHLAQS